MYELISNALSIGLTFLEWELVAQSLEFLKNCELRAFLCACNFMPGDMDRDDMIEKLMEFLG